MTPLMIYSKKYYALLIVVYTQNNSQKGAFKSVGWWKPFGYLVKFNILTEQWPSG